MSNEINYKYPEVARIAKSINIEKLRLTDSVFAENAATILNGRVLYWKESDKWLVWNGKRWELDPPGNIFPYIKDIVKSLIANVVNIDNNASKNKLYSEIIKYEGHHKQETLIAALSVIPEIIITCDHLDSNVMSLNCANGTLDLNTGILMPHSPYDHITKLVNIEYDKQADCPVFIEFMNKIFEGNQNMISYMQRFFGYCLTGRIDEQVMLFFYGTGANGKTTLVNILYDILSDFACSSSADLLTYRDNPSISNDIARLAGKRLVIVNEVEEGKRLAEAKVKNLTGGDKLSARFLFKEAFEFVPQFKIVLIGNHKPKIKGRDHGIWRRIHLIPFSVTIPKEEIDPNLPNILKSEYTGILKWAVEGCLECLNTGLNAPPEITNAVKDYRNQEDTFSQWLTDCCQMSNTEQAYSADLLKSYQDYSEFHETTSNSLTGMLNEIGGLRKGRNSKGKYWTGIKLIAQCDNFESFHNSDI